jgi:lipoyl(octanoyl) transferase
MLHADLSLIPFDEALHLQRGLAKARIAGALADDVLVLCEHPPVVTLGRRTSADHLLTPAEQLEALGVEVREIERGGDVTYHAPGQLVGYPILDLKQHRQDLHWYLRQVEEALIRAVGAFGIGAARNPGYTGVWVDGRKLASIGVHAREWVTWHGFALNVTTDLAGFAHIVPCGIDGVTMTSLKAELGRGLVDLDAVRRAVIAAFGEVFERPMAPADPAELRALAAAVVAAG